jgi:hypothetical protein
MAYEIGTATDYNDLMAKVNTFLTTQLPEAERYTTLRHVTIDPLANELILVAPGMSAGEQIFMGMCDYADIGGDYYNWMVNIFTGYIPENTFETQPDGVGNSLGIPLWNASIPYWIIGNGQRFVLAAKIANTYQMLYLGKINAYATPNQWPYPVFVGAMFNSPRGIRYSDQDYQVFWQNQHQAGGSGNYGPCKLRQPNGWGYGNHEANMALEMEVLISPYNDNLLYRNTASDSDLASGYYGLHPIVLSSYSFSGTDHYIGNVWGELDGVYCVSGYNNASESIVTVDSVDYIVIGNVARTGLMDFCAMRLQ